MPGEKLIIESRWEKIKGNEVLCSIKVKSGERTIAKGTTSQKVIRKAKIEKIFNDLRKG